MSSWWINNVTAPDNNPTRLSTLDNLPFLDHININVVNAAIYYQIKSADPHVANDTWGVWQPPIFFLPSQQSLYRVGAIGVRFYAAITAALLPAGSSQAQVTIEAVSI